jgi:hypothetical protein
VAVDKTWTAFKRFFATEYHDLKEQQKVNTPQTNFHSANAAVNISTALDNLTLATSLDRDIVAQLTSANQQLTATNKLLTEQLQTDITTNAKLELVSKLGTNTNTSPTNPTSGKTCPHAPFN